MSDGCWALCHLPYGKVDGAVSEIQGLIGDTLEPVAAGRWWQLGAIAAKEISGQDVHQYGYKWACDDEPIISPRSFFSDQPVDLCVWWYILDICLDIFSWIWRWLDVGGWNSNDKRHDFEICFLRRRCPACPSPASLFYLIQALLNTPICNIVPGSIKTRRTSKFWVDVPNALSLVWVKIHWSRTPPLLESMATSYIQFGNAKAHDECNFCLNFTI